MSAGTCRPLPTVRIHYLRPPDRETVYEQLLLHDDGRVKVTFARSLSLDAPLVVDGEPVLENGSDAVWFTFPGAWHDIGRFHRADGTHTGIYANVITPCLFEPGGVWRTTDLFVDVWWPAGRAAPGRKPPPRLLDLDELVAAEAAGHLGAKLADRARAEGKELLARARAGRWPPAVVEDWPRERALRLVEGARPATRGSSFVETS